MNNRWSLTQNRKSLTPRQSMEAIINYARQQDSKLLGKTRVGHRAYAFLHGLFFAPIIFYVVYQFSLGYWPSLYPRTIAANVMQFPVNHNKFYLAPELYLKDLEKYKEDLRIKETQQIHKALTH